MAIKIGYLRHLTKREVLPKGGKYEQNTISVSVPVCGIGAIVDVSGVTL